MTAMNGSSAGGGGGSSTTPSELAAMLRQSADVVERKEFHPLLYKTMRALTAYAGEYADGGIHAATGGAPAAPNSAHPTPNKFRRKDAAGSERGRGDPPGKAKSAFDGVPDDILDAKPKHKGGRSASPSPGGAAAAAERVGAPGGQFSSAATAAGSKAEQRPSHKGLFGLKGLKKGIEKIGEAFEHSKEDAPFDEYAWCDEHFTRGCACKSRKNQANHIAEDKDPSTTVRSAPSNESSSSQPQQPSSSGEVNDPDKPAKPCFQRPINPSSNLIANGWIDQQRRSKMRVVWKDVLASLVEGRRPGEETTLWIQRQVINQQTGKVTGLEALHQIPMKWLEDVNYVDLYGDHRFTLKVHNIAEEFYFRTRDEESAQSWVLTLRSARDASVQQGGNRMNGGETGEKAKPSAKDMGLHDLDDWEEGGGGGAAAGSSPQAGSEAEGERRPSSAGAQPQQQQQPPQQPQPTQVRMKVSELRAIAHGAGYDTRGMERQDLERIAAYVRSGQFNPQNAGAPTAGSASDVNQSRQQEEKEKAQRAAQEEKARRQKEIDERVAAEKMRLSREKEEQKRMEEQMKATAAKQQRQRQELEAKAAEIKRKQEAERQRKLAELQASERARQQQQQAQTQGHIPTHIPTPPTSGGYPQQHPQQHWQQQQQNHQQQQHWQQQGFPCQPGHQPHQFFNRGQPQQGGYQQPQQQHAHFQQQQQRPPQQPQKPQGAQTAGNAAFEHSKYMEQKDEEEQSAAALQIKRAILINWALQPPSLNVLRPIDQLITTIHTAMPPAFGVATHAYFAKFTPILRTELVVSSAMGNHPDETKMKKAVRKVRVFLHPDKLPRDLSSDQQFMARMLWDITSDSWEEYQKHKDELDWIRS